MLGELTCKDLSLSNIIRSSYTHKLVCAYGIIWYDTPGRLWSRRRFPQCRCRRLDEPYDFLTSIAVRSSAYECLDFPQWAAEHSAAVARATRSSQPIIELNDQPEPEWNTGHDSWLEIRDRTTDRSHRSSGDIIEWKEVADRHEMVACVQAPSEYDIQLTIGFSRSR